MNSVKENVASLVISRTYPKTKYILSYNISIWLIARDSLELALNRSDVPEIVLQIVTERGARIGINRAMKHTFIEGIYQGLKRLVLA